MPDKDPQPDQPKSDKDEMTEAEIDMNLAQSFPASDPPSWTLGTNHRAKLEVTDDSGLSPQSQQRRDEPRE